ncbi:MAG TPA: three-Cys-motif partner protein TcmP [Rhizomicrobium sp.]|nr:three-Cys-motif partner protein TcmP [Rhizomicrobium sp.]
MRKPVQKFGGAHTEKKLAKLEAYLKAYSTALKNQNFRLIYFDAFAGTGDIQIAGATPLLEGVDEYAPFIKGSAQRALNFGKAFHRYIFVEKSQSKVRQLKDLRDGFPAIADRIDILHGDANYHLTNFCSGTNWKNTRAIVFLDPFGNQISWKTVVSIAETKAIDLWYLFPAGLGVLRQISKNKGVHETHRASLNTLLGTEEWHQTFIETTSAPGLFDENENQERRATVESVTRFMIERMKEIFAGGVLDEWLPLGSRGIHMYSLLFAWANPSGKAKLAGKLARAVLRSGNRGRA